ncbi:Gluconate 2-dehydrogenase flavoprotein precursor [Oceaniovalibus guishaninsula JLT2003]|uniref:Gluconate 2-dehydrogenase flavoprotein n=1 Tax=Oceaniovalibus guishaninsula JLT2003 TaxID=1231392 RepID=K2GQ98_9RHOB|nr:GMC family oxidoreductase [Oceaniovalibus guishaninsula]EKE44846.1 Gluconate 2-dehydrogenase flavoprotein precursor [Oceaniovalibus guishaninsula JLT2003]
MATEMPKKDVVIVGLGWTGSILAMELSKEGLDIVALERGPMRRTVPDWQYPINTDELTHAHHFELMQRPRHSTLTMRHGLDDTALPYRKLGSFLPGHGVGGAGVHWNGQNWRPQVAEFRLKSYVTETFGADVIPEKMQIQDWGVEYDELEPYFDRWERLIGCTGIAGNLNGTIQPGGNPFEAPRSADYPLPPLPEGAAARFFRDTAEAMGLHPFPRPGGNASRAYVNEYGMQLGPCTYCGFCEWYGCYNYSKATPQTCVLDALYQQPNFEVRTGADVMRVELASDGKTATGVTYVTDDMQEVFQPADLVLICAFPLHSTHLMLLSGIGKPYDPRTGEGVTGRNYAYQMMGSTSAYFADAEFKPFVGAGIDGYSVLDYGVEQIDFAKEGFIGGSYISVGHTNGQPIRSMSLPEGTPNWGAGWKKAIGDWYGKSLSVSSHGSNMAYRDCYLDLDPTYRDPYGRPLLRMTFDWKQNDIRMTQFMKKQTEAMAKAMQPDSFKSSYKDADSHYDIRPYQTTHNVGGLPMGNDPATSAVNRYLQSWDVHNVFVSGASAFPQNIQFNPTGAVGALTYWMADALRSDYLKNPRPLM